MWRILAWVLGQWAEPGPARYNEIGTERRESGSFGMDGLNLKEIIISRSRKRCGATAESQKFNTPLDFGLNGE